MNRLSLRAIPVALAMLMIVLSRSPETRAQDDPAVTSPAAPGTSAPAAVDAANAGWDEIGTGSASAGGISANTGNSEFPVLAMSSGGRMYVAWDDNSTGDGEIYLKYRAGSTVWKSLDGSASGGGISNNTGDSDGPALAIGSDVLGYPIIAWADASPGNYEIYVKRYDGADWVEMGQNSAAANGISGNQGNSYEPSLVLDRDGFAIVAWTDDTSGDGEIYVKRYNGATWSPMSISSAIGGGISNNTGFSGSPSMVLGSDGNPVIAWSDTSSGDSEIYVRRWNGTAWVEMGSGSASGGGISNNAGESFYPSLAVGPDGSLVVAWEDDSNGNSETYVRRWEDSAWVEMGSGSASGGGISNDNGDSKNPSLAIGPDGGPVVAWVDGNAGDREIYLRRWFGSTWVEMAGGSATGGGISNMAAGNSLYPSLAFSPDGVSAVAWSDDNPGNLEIYVRRYINGPRITKLVPAAGGVGTTIAISGASLAGTTAVKFNTTSATTINNVTAKLVTVVVPDGATTGKITLTSASGVAVSSGSFKVTPAAPSISSFSPNSGPVGSTVTINGANLGNVSMVKFGTKTASFTSDSATQLTATVPAGARTGKISVIGPGGIARSASNFIVVGAPTITRFAPTAGAVGSVVLITGKNLSEATVSFNGTAAVPNINTATKITVKVPVGATSGPITISTPGGTATSATNFTVQ